MIFSSVKSYYSYRRYSSVGRALDRWSRIRWFEHAVRYYFSPNSFCLIAYVLTDGDPQLEWFKGNESYRVYWYETRFLFLSVFVSCLRCKGPFLTYKEKWIVGNQTNNTAFTNYKYSFQLLGECRCLWTRDSLRAHVHVAKFCGRPRLIRSVLRASNKKNEILILWVYYTIPFGFSSLRHFGASHFNILNYFVWLRITDECSVPEMCISSILLITSDFKWCIHLSRSLFLYFNYLVSVAAGGPESPRGYMKPSFAVDLGWFVAFWEHQNFRVNIDWNGNLAGLLHNPFWI